MTVSQDTVQEFGLKKNDIKIYDGDDQSRWDFIEQNKRLTQKFSHIKKVHYLSKLKINLEHHESSKERNERKI